MAKTLSYTIKDFYKSYVNHTSFNKSYFVEYKVFRAIIVDYFKYLRDSILEEGRTCKLPARLGTLGVIKHKPKEYAAPSLRVDFKATREYGKIIYHLNEHSRGFKYRFHWSKQNVITRGSANYKLIMTRANKRRLAKIIKNNERDYIEIQ